MDFALGADGQKIFGENGYRPILAEVAATLRLPDAAEALHDRRDLGGWPAVKDEFFDPDNGVRRRRSSPGQGIATE